MDIDMRTSPILLLVLLFGCGKSQTSQTHNEPIEKIEKPENLSSPSIDAEVDYVRFSGGKIMIFVKSDPNMLDNVAYWCEDEFLIDGKPATADQVLHYANNCKSKVKMWISHHKYRTSHRTRFTTIK